jgi:hypothetical protein
MMTLSWLEYISGVNWLEYISGVKKINVPGLIVIICIGVFAVVFDISMLLFIWKIIGTEFN